MRAQAAPTRPRRSLLARGLVGIVVVAFLIASLLVQPGLAARPGKTITLGESLTDDQRKEMLEYFEAEPGDEVITVTEKETDEAMKGIIEFGPNAPVGAYSSTALSCRDLGDGLDVTTRNITLVTPSMYAMALVTAGIGDAKLVVAAPSNSPALGLTALAGVFKTWEIAPCESGSTTKERQRLALEQLALATQIGQAISTPGSNDGVPPAANVILETQKTIVTERLRKRSEIDAALEAQERAAGIAIPAEYRGRLVDLFVRLARADIDWSTFSAGWTIRYRGDTSITMRGEGIAIRRARQTATAQAAAALTATAEAQAAMTATASQMLTATAAAATQQAIAAMTATAAAQPTATPVPTPTPFAVTGKITDVRGDQLSVRPAGADDPVPYTVDAAATIKRDGQPARLEDLKKGDLVALTVDSTTRHVREITATAAPASLLAQLLRLWWIVPAGALVPLVLLLKGRVAGEPFVVKRIAAT